MGLSYPNKARNSSKTRLRLGGLGVNLRLHPGFSPLFFIVYHKFRLFAKAAAGERALSENMQKCLRTGAAKEAGRGSYSNHQNSWQKFGGQSAHGCVAVLDGRQPACVLRLALPSFFVTNSEACYRYSQLVPARAALSWNTGAEGEKSERRARDELMARYPARQDAAGGLPCGH